MSDKYIDEFTDFLFQYGILVSRLEKAYPKYMLDTTNPETSSIYNTIQKQIQNVYTNLDTLETKIDNDNIKKQNLLDKYNSEIESNKTFYKVKKPELNNIIQNIQADEPREKQYKYRLMNQYMDSGYLVLLIIGIIIAFRKLLY